MAFDAFLKLEGIEGDSADKEHAKSIEVQSFSWGVSNVTSPGTGAGGGSGKAQMQDFHFTMATSQASPQLMLACASGKHLREATLSVRKSGERPVDFLTVKLTDVLISSYQASGSEFDVMDSASLAFVKIDFVVHKQSPTGGVS